VETLNTSLMHSWEPREWRLGTAQYVAKNGGGPSRIKNTKMQCSEKLLQVTEPGRLSMSMSSRESDGQLEVAVDQICTTLIM